MGSANLRILTFGVAASLLVACRGVLPQERPLVIANTTLIDGTGAPARNGVTILIREGLITEIAPANETTLPEGATVIDGAGRYVIPGLADMHVHFGTGGLGPTDAESRDRVLRQFVSYGVTTVLNLGATHGTLESIDTLRGRIADGTLVGPTIHATGGLITVPGSHPVGTIMFPPEGEDPQTYDWTTRGVFIVDTPEVMRSTVDRLVDGGADATKVIIESGPPPFGDKHPQMSFEMVTAAAEAAHARGLPLLAHASSIDELEVALDAGVDGIVHLVRHPTTPPDALFARMRDAGVWYMPTMGIHVWPDVWGDPADQFTEPFLREGVDPAAIESLLDSPLLPRAPASDEAWAVRRAAVAALAAAHRAGVRIVGGSDVSNPAIFPGYSMHHELALMVEAGMSPMEAIVASTSRAAAVLGRDDFGTIRPGQRADLLVLAANPLEDIRNTRTLELVILGGAVIDRSSLLPDE